MIISKLLLLLTSIIFLVMNSQISTVTITSILIGIITLSLGLLLPELFHNDDFYIEKKEYHLYYDNSLGEKRLFFDILLCIFIALSFKFHSLIYFVPVLFYDISCFRLYLSGICGIAAVIYMSYSLPSGISALMVILAIISFAINQENLAMIYSEHEMRKLRDNTAEHQLLIEEKNRQLIASQDASIYMATLKERNRIAREIHDNVGHMLTRSILQTGAIKAINKDTALIPNIDALSDTLNTAMENIRTSVHDLHDEAIDMEAAIKDILQPITSFDTSFEYDMDSHVPRNVKYCFISITQEAVNNTIKYSNGDFIKVILREHPAFYQMMIYDNGNNIHMDTSHGIGLKNISDRVNALKGNLKIDTNGGFKLLVTIMKEEK